MAKFANKETTTEIHADKANLIQVSESEAVYKTVNVYAKEFVHLKANDVEKVIDIKVDFILGKPPFIGKHLMNANQRSDMDLIFNGVNGGGVLDYVTVWYIKAAAYMKSCNGKDTAILAKTAFVSTNSIAQGEQVGVL